jgi:hypothetical protein
MPDRPSGALVAAICTSLALLSAGCVKPIAPIYTSTEARIWVVRGAAEVYRCVDMASEGKGPQPVCVQAERVTKSE